MLHLLRCAFFRTYSSTRYHAKYQVPGTGMYVCTHPFAFLIDCPLLVLFMFLFFRKKLHLNCQSERDIASKHTVKHRAISFAQRYIGIIRSYFFSLHILIYPSSASVAVGVGHPRSGPLYFYIHYAWGILPLQRDWSLSCGHGLENAS